MVPRGETGSWVACLGAASDGGFTADVPPVCAQGGRFALSWAEADGERNNAPRASCICKARIKPGAAQLSFIIFKMHFFALAERVAIPRRPRRRHRRKTPSSRWGRYVSKGRWHTGNR